jgi:hypothetical protein
MTNSNHHRRGRRRRTEELQPPPAPADRDQEPLRMCADLTLPSDIL